jgi:hypothetical protein
MSQISREEQEELLSPLQLLSIGGAAMTAYGSLDPIKLILLSILILKVVHVSACWCTMQKHVQNQQQNTFKELNAKKNLAPHDTGTQKESIQ